jgi:hypothetical protein
VNNDHLTELQERREIKRSRQLAKSAAREPSTEPELSFIEPSKEEKRIGKLLQSVRSKLLNNKGDLKEFAEIASAYFNGRYVMRLMDSRV